MASTSAAAAAAASTAAADSAAATNGAATATATSSEFFKKVRKTLHENQVHYKMASGLVTFDSTTRKFTFKAFGAEKGVECYRSEAIKVAQLLSPMYDYLKKTKECLEEEKNNEIEGCAHEEIVQQNTEFAKKMEIQIYNQNPLLFLTLYKLKTDDGLPRPCPGSFVFREAQDDPQDLLNFIIQCMPTKEPYKAYPKKA
jgi:hypothetical protein